MPVHRLSSSSPPRSDRADSGTPAATRNSGWRPSILEFILLLLIVAAAGWGLRSLGRTMESHITMQREATIANLFQSSDYRISYRDISPSLLRAFEIRDLAISNGNSSDDPLVFIRHLRLRYSLALLVTSRDPVAALREIKLVNSDFTVDLDREQEIGPLLDALSVAVSGSGAGDSRAPLPPIDLAGANLGLIIKGDGVRVELRDLFFRVRAGETLRITANSNVRALLAHTGAATLLGSTSLDTDVRIDGMATNDFSSAAVTVRIPELVMSGFTTSPLNLRVAIDSETVQVARVEDRTPIDLALSHHLDSGRSELRLAADGLQLDDLAELTRQDPVLDALRGATLTGNGHWIHDPKRGIGYGGVFDVRLAAGDGDQAANVALAVSGNGQRVVLSRLAADFEESSLQFTGDVLIDRFAPQGELIVSSPPVVPGGGRLQGRITILRTDDGLQLRSDELAIGDTAVRGFAADVVAVAADPRTFRYRARAELAQDDDNTIGAEGLLKLGADGVLELVASLSDVTAANLYRLASAPDRRRVELTATLEPLLVSADLSATTNFATLRLERSSVRVRDRSDSETWLRLRVERDTGGWLIEDLVGRWRGLRLRGDARMTPAEERLEMAANLSIDDRPYQLRATHRPGDGITVTGSHQLQLAATYGADEAVSFRGSVAGLPIPVSSSIAPLEVTMAFDGTLAAAGGWTLGSEAVTLVLRGGELRLSGSGSVTYAGQTGGVAGRLTLFAADEGEQYAATVTITEGVLNATAEIRGVPLARFGEFPVSGALRASITASGPPDQLAWHAELDLEDGRFNADTVSLTASVAFADGNLDVDNLSFDLLSHHLSAGVMRYDGKRRTASFDADYRAEYFGEAVAAHLRLTANDLSVGDGRSLQDAFAGGVRATLYTSTLQVADEAFEDWQLALHIMRHDGATGSGRRSGAGADAKLVVHFDGGPHGAFAGFISTIGGFQIAVGDGPYPLRGTAEGTIADGQITATVELEEADATVINTLLSGAPITVESGRAQGSARVDGPLNDPDFWGEVRVTGGSVASSLSPQVVGPFAVDLSMMEKQVSISGFVSETGTALPVTLRGAATLEHWVPTSFALQLATTDTDGVALDYQFGPMLFDGRASGAIAVAGVGDQVSVSGQLEVVRADISIGEVAEQAPGVGSLEADLAITTGRGVQFTWPSTQFPMLRVMLAPSEQVRVGYHGAAEGFSVNGEVDIRSGDLFYFNRQFRLREGRIGFAENENRFDPRLEVRAETREQGAAGDPVRIILEADTTLSRFSPDTVRLSSDPPSALAMDALVRDPLAGEGAEVTGGAGLSAAAFSGDLLAQVALLQPVERALRETLGVDMVSIRSPFVQNLVLDGLATTDNERDGGVIGNPLDNTSLSFGKYLGSDLFLIMLLRLGTSGDSPSSEPSLLSDIELSLEWATPFFMLEWSFLPRNANTLFVTDNAITLRWGWRY